MYLQETSRLFSDHFVSEAHSFLSKSPEGKSYMQSDLIRANSQTKKKKKQSHTLTHCHTHGQKQFNKLRNDPVGQFLEENEITSNLEGTHIT